MKTVAVYTANLIGKWPQKVDKRSWLIYVSSVDRIIEAASDCSLFKDDELFRRSPILLSASHISESHSKLTMPHPTPIRLFQTRSWQLDWYLKIYGTQKKIVKAR